MKYFPSLLHVFALIAILAGGVRADQLTVTYPLPPAPAGTPRALFPTPRLDWLDQFQNNLNKLKAGPYEMIWDGDSITYGWLGAGKAVWAGHFGKIKTLDLGISGDQVQNVLWRVQHGELEGQDPKLIMLMIGTNNNGQDPQIISTAIKLLIGEYETRCPHAQILLLAVFPRNILPTDGSRLWVAKLNAVISGLASDPRVTYLDFGANFLQPDGTLPPTIMPDALHPNAAGYEIWSQAIIPVVEKYFPGRTVATAPAPAPAPAPVPAPAPAPIAAPTAK